MQLQRGCGLDFAMKALSVRHLILATTGREVIKDILSWTRCWLAMHVWREEGGSGVATRKAGWRRFDVLWDAALVGWDGEPGTTLSRMSA